MKGLILFAIAYGMTTIENGVTTLADVLAFIKGEHGSKATSAGSKAYKTLLANKIHEFKMSVAGGAEESFDFSPGDDLNDYLKTTFTNEEDFRLALAEWHAEEQAKRTSLPPESDDTFGRNDDKTIKTGYSLLPRKTQKDQRVFEHATKQEFIDSKKKYWHKIQMLISSFSALTGQKATEAKDKAGNIVDMYQVQYSGTAFTPFSPEGAHLSLRTNTQYTMPSKETWSELYGADKYGCPTDVSAEKEMALNLKVSRKEANKSVMASNDPVWVAKVVADGGETAIVNGKPTVFLKDRESTDEGQYSHEGFLTLVPLKQHKLLDEMMSKRAMDSVQTDTNSKERKNKIAELADLKAQLVLMNFSEEQIQAQMSVAIANL